MNNINVNHVCRRLLKKSCICLERLGSTPNRAVQGSNPGQGHCVVFLGKTIVASEFNTEGSPAID